MRPIIKGVSPCVTAVVVYDFHTQLASINRTATCITHGMKYARLEVSSGKDQLKFVCLRRSICNLSIYLPIRLNPRRGHQMGSGEPSAGG